MRARKALGTLAAVMGSKAQDLFSLTQEHSVLGGVVGCCPSSKRPTLVMVMRIGRRVPGIDGGRGILGRTSCGVRGTEGLTSHRIDRRGMS